jgi:hypothetical protein
MKSTPIYSPSSLPGTAAASYSSSYLALVNATDHWRRRKSRPAIQSWQRLQVRCKLAGMKPKPTYNGELVARADLIIEVASPEVAADKLGWTVDAVIARREKLGLPDPLSRRERLERQAKR